MRLRPPVVPPVDRRGVERDRGRVAEGDLLPRPRRPEAAQHRRGAAQGHVLHRWRQRQAAEGTGEIGKGLLGLNVFAFSSKWVLTTKSSAVGPYLFYFFSDTFKALIFLKNILYFVVFKHSLSAVLNFFSVPLLEINHFDFLLPCNSSVKADLILSD